MTKKVSDKNIIEGVDTPSIETQTQEVVVEKEVVATDENIKQEEVVLKSIYDGVLAENERLKAVISNLEKALEEKSEVKSAKKSDPVSFEFEGEKYQFSASAPQSILLNGKGVSQKEIAKNDELKLQLIGGNSSLIIKK